MAAASPSLRRGARRLGCWGTQAGGGSRSRAGGGAGNIQPRGPLTADDQGQGQEGVRLIPTLSS